MGKKLIENGIAIDKFKFKKWLEDNNLTQREIADTIGMAESTFSNQVTSGYLAKSVGLLLGHIYELNLKDIAPDEPKPVEKVVGLNEALDLRLNDIQKRLTALETKLVEFLDNMPKENVKPLEPTEKACLLLDIFLKYGSCEERLFRQRCSNEGISSNAQTQAITLKKCNKKLINGKMWLEV